MAANSPLIWKQIYGNELYVYFCGNLIYKKWLNTGAERVFYEGEGEHEKLLKQLKIPKVVYPCTLDVSPREDEYVGTIDWQPQE